MTPTIVAASLSDSELRNSIDKLVKYVENGTKRMADSFDAQVERMKKSLASLGGSKASTSTSSASSSVEKEAVSYDKLAAAAKRAAKGKKEARLEYITSDIDKSLTYIIDHSKNVERQLEAIMRKEQALAEAKRREVEETLALAQAQQQVRAGVSGSSIGYGTVEDMQNQSIRNRVINTRSLIAETKTLEQTVASLIGVESRDLNLNTSIASSYSALSNLIGQLTKAYREMTQQERDSAIGRELAEKIQQTSRAIQQIQKQMNRPTDIKNVLGLDEKTLDSIAYKMQQLSLYRSGLDVNVRKNEIEQVNREYDRLKKKQDEVMQKNSSLMASNQALGRSWNYMKNRLAFYFTVGASTAFIKNLIDIRSQYEMNERALGILINSAERGTEIFKELSNMALVSPYTLIELSNAAKQLTAYDIAAKDVVETTRRLADMAAAVGVPMERLTYALGQIKAYGYLNSRDARMFLNAGIPLVKSLSEYYSELEGRIVSVGDVYDRIKKKAVGFNDVMKVVNSMTDEGGRFFDFQAKMADTLKVRLANLTLAWNNMLNEIGHESQGVLTTGIGALRKLFLHWKDIDKLIRDVVYTLGMAKIGQVLFIASRNFDLLGRKMTWNIILGKRLTSVIVSLAASLKSIVSSPMAWLSLWSLAMTSAVSTIIEARKAVEALNKSIRDGAKESFDSIQKTLDSLKGVRDSLYKAEKYADVDIYDTKTGKVTSATMPSGKITIQNISESEAIKAWEQIREEIELTSKSSDYFIGRLLAIDDTNERVRKGFEYLEQIRDVLGALQDIGDETIKVQQDYSKWWNLGFGFDSLTENLQDYSTALKVAEGETGGFAATVERAAYLFTDAYRLPSKLVGLDWLDEFFRAVFPESIGDTETALYRVRQNLIATSDSMVQFLSGKNLNAEQWREAYEQITNKILQDSNLSQREQLTYRLEQEKSFLAARAKMFEEDREYIRQQEGKLTNEEIKQRLAVVDANQAAWLKGFGESRALTDAFYDFLRQQHRSEIDNMFGLLSKKELESLDTSVPKWREWAKKNAQEFSDRWKVPFDELWQRIDDTNKMKIFIKTVIGDKDEDSVYDKLTKADNDLADAQKRRERLTERRTQLEKEGKAATEEYTKVQGELTQAVTDYNDAVERGGKLKDKSKSGSKKDPLLDALKDEIRLVEKLQSDYDKLTKSGASQSDALAVIRSAYGDTIRILNSKLGSAGLPELSTMLITGKDPNKALAHFKETLQSLVSRGMLTLERSKELEAVIEKLTISAKTYNLDKITKGLNNELSKLKDEYELAVELDANPEFGGAFAEMFGIDMSQLPRTAAEYADKYTKAINDALQKEYPNLEIPNLLDMTDSDLEKFRELVDTEQLGEMWYELIEKGYKAAQDIRQKEAKETIKEWSTLVEKYGGLQAKLLKIYKDSVQEQLNIIRNFGNDEEVKQALDLVSRINISQDPTEIARLQGELADVIKKVAEREPQAGKVYEATDNSQKRLTSQAYWDDFKDSDLYTMTFEDMSNNSVRAIRAIINELNNLKGKVEEDPASMKALMKSLEDAEKELVERNPFKALTSSIGEWARAMNEARDAKRDLSKAEKEENDAKKEVKNAGTDPNKLADAQSKLANATNKRKQAQAALTTAENKEQKASQKLKSSLQGISDMYSNLNEISGVLSDMFRMGGDDKTADAIDEICNGFSAMTTLIMGVVVAMEVLQSTSPWLLAISAALGIIVGLVNFLINADNKAIDKKVEESERRVKRLELAYLDLEQAAKDAYGTDIIGAQKAALANKQLQLAELQRQIELEKSRQTKFRDEEKILDLQKSYKELALEIQNDTEQMVNDLLSVSSRASFAEDLVSSMVDAFKNGEDYMAVFEEKFEDMVDSLIIKAITAKVVGFYIDKLFDQMQERIDERTKEPADRLAKSQEELTRVQNMTDNELGRELLTQGANNQNVSSWIAWKRWQVQDEYDRAKAELDKAKEVTDDDIMRFITDTEAIDDELAPKLEELIKRWYTYGQDADKATNLSALQAGIQGITEETAGALESYMNGVSQQVYLHSELLTQIRDAIVGWEHDAQLGIQSQMLLQLQNSYQTQQAIQNILEGTLNPSGRAFTVELI